MAAHDAHWELYPTEVDDALAWISYDHAAHEHLASLPSTWLRVRVALPHPDDDGLPTHADMDMLSTLEDGLERWLAGHACVPVGRVSYGGARYLSFYAPREPVGLRGHLRTLGRAHGTTLDVVVRADPEHEGYLQELWPSDDDWVAIEDRQRLDELLARGARLSEPFTFHRTVVVPDAATADALGAWATDQGFTLATWSTVDDGVAVRFHETRVPRLVDLAARSVAVRRKAEALGGRDEGWEV